MSQQTARGQVGIGTVAAFIAMVLVAAIAAGVLITVAGLLQTEADQTAAESTQQVSDRLQVLSVTGRVTDQAAVDGYNFTVSKAPGSGDVQLANITYQVVDSVTGETHATGAVADAGPTAVGVLTAETDDRVITEKSDRYILSLNASAMGTELGPGESLLVVFTTESGASTKVIVSAPESLAGRSTASL